MAVDLHVHSNASDGTFDPGEIVQKANELGLSAVSITDHDSIAGLEPALEKSAGLNITMIPGIELSSIRDGADIHILGYFIDYKNPDMDRSLRKLRDSRRSRAQAMVERLRDAGFGITFEEVDEYAQGGAIGRPHIAQILVKHGAVRDISEAFEKYISAGGPAYMPKYVLDITEIIPLIHRVGGITSLAHPGTSKVDEEVVVELKSQGIDAIEVWHSDHTDDQRVFYQRLAKKYDLLVTGGSDCHGQGKSRGVVLGSLDIPDGIIQPILDRSNEIRARISP